MRYPVAYRSGARKYQSGGFQEPVTVPAPGAPRNPMKPPYTAPPKPANDPYPRPDNDNVPGRGRWEHPPFPKLPSWPGYAPALADAAFSRLLPPGARRAWEFGRLVLNFDGEFPDYRQLGEIDMPPGWVKGCGPSTPPLAYNLRTAFHRIGTAGLCGLGMQALGDGSAHPGSTWDRALYAKSLEVNPGQASSTRWYIISFYQRVSGKAALIYRVPLMPNVLPMAVPEPLPATVTNPLPATFSPPVGDAVPANRPWPGALPRPAPGVYVKPVNSVAEAKWPGALPRPAPGVYVKPVNTVAETKWPQLGKVTDPVVVVAPPTVTNPVRRPPGKHVKERKFWAAPGALVWALGVAAGIYEDAKFAQDILDAWYNALPKYLKEPGLRPDQKALALYRHYDKLDIEKAILGVMIAVAGEKAGAYIDKARRVTGDGLGLNMYISIPTGSAPRW